MKGKITLLTGAGLGYVLGARAGRERYESLKQQATRTVEKVRRDPRVQQAATQASATAKDKASVAAQAAKDKVGGSDSSSATPSSTSSTGPSTGTPGASGTTGTNGVTSEGYPRTGGA